MRFNTEIKSPNIVNKISEHNHRRFCDSNLHDKLLLRKDQYPSNSTKMIPRLGPYMGICE